MAVAEGDPFLERARALHARVPVVELHGDVPLETWPRRRSGEQDPLARTWLPRWRAAGIDVELLTAGGDMPVSCDAGGRPDLRALEMFADAAGEADACAGLRLVREARDLEAALAAGQVALVLHLEGCAPLRGSLDVLHTLADAGLRSVQLTWNPRNEAADGVGVDGAGGLTPFGRDVVRELQRLGILLDLSHLAPAGVAEVLALAEGPVVASHANAAALCPHPRNLADDVIREIAATGGVVGLCFFPLFVGDPATADRVVDHAEHVAALVGPEHLALGPDYVVELRDTMLADMGGDLALYPEGWDAFPPGLERVETLPALTAALLRRGWSEADCAAVAGGNALRVLRAVLR